MAFTVTEFHDLVGILEAHPEWQQELRRLVLTGELLALPEIVRDLAQAQQRTEQRLDELAQAQQRTEQRLERLEETVQALAEAQQRTEERLQSLIESVQILTRRVEGLTDDVGTLKEIALEQKYRENAPAYFGGPTFRRVRALPTYEVANLLEDAIERGDLTWEERQDILNADLVVRGQPPDREETHLVVEISWGVGASDVTRASRRAKQLMKVVKHAMPAVAGKFIIPEAESMAEQMKVAQATDGRIIWPDSPTDS
ncbi:MAG: hypothetical protein MAG451_00946 [Anaerolineales bacterium]|nr:hypothetical protein [Anaerolineales bacterium]